MANAGFWNRMRAVIGPVSVGTVVVIAGCGGGGVVERDPISKDCVPGIVTGFTGKFDDEPVRVVNEEGVEGVGSPGEGAPGIGAGGALGQFVNVKITVEFASSQKYSAIVGNEKGMVTIVPCTLEAPALVTLEGQPGGRYYDEARDRDLPFENGTLRTVINSFDKNVGITTFTEAMVRRAERVGATKGAVAGKSWKNPQIVEAAHNEILDAINRHLPGIYRLDDLRRLPVILNAARAAAGSGALTDDQNGKYGAVLAALVEVANANLGEEESAPALAINDQLAADLADGLLDLIDQGQSVAAGKSPAYTFESLWSLQTVAATEAAQKSGTGKLATAKIPFDQTKVVRVDRDGVAYGSVDISHDSDGVLRYTETLVGCNDINLTILDVRQKRVLTAISRDGKTMYQAQPGASRCELKFAHPFTVPGKSIASMDGLGTVFRTTDGRFYLFVYLGEGVDPWWELVVDGPPPIYMSVAFGYIWTLTEAGEVHQYVYSEQDGLIFDEATRTARPPANTGLLVPLPDRVIQIANSADNRETFALTTVGELFWLDLRDENGVRDPLIAPMPQSLGRAEVCWMSEGIVVVFCDGLSFQVISAVTDLNAPPIYDYIDAAGNRIFLPGTGDIRIDPLVRSQTPIWRSTDQRQFADGAILPSQLSNPARLIGVDGSLRTLSGEVLSPAIQ